MGVARSDWPVPPAGLATLVAAFAREALDPRVRGDDGITEAEVPGAGRRRVHRVRPALHSSSSHEGA